MYVFFQRYIICGRKFLIKIAALLQILDLLTQAESVYYKKNWQLTAVAA